MYDAIKNFPTQFLFDPIIENASTFSRHDRFLVAGMGGSHLAAGLLKIWKPDLDIIIHRDYGIPSLPEALLTQRLFIASSYSGNTEETIDSFIAAGQRHCARAVIAVGGKLLEMAKKENVPFVQLPHTGIQPRSALGYSIIALLKLMDDEDAIGSLRQLAATINADELRQEGEILAKALQTRIPVIYASTQNYPIAYNWKIKFNETGKIPAFCNAIPELNHNEMTGFDVKERTNILSERIHFIILKDSTDDPRIQKRMDILQQLYQDRTLPVIVKEIHGATVFEKIFSSLLLADWTAYYTALSYQLEPEQVPMVEQFKQLMQQ